MSSNRVYSEILCLNPFCDVRFNPVDKRHFYHSKQCRSNFNNDKSHFLESLGNKPLMKIEFDRWILKALFQNLAYSGLIAEKNLLKLYFDFTVGEWNENVDSQRPIKWFLDFGLEMVNKEERIFEIHKRKIN